MDDEGCRAKRQVRNMPTEFVYIPRTLSQDQCFLARFFYIQVQCLAALRDVIEEVLLQLGRVCQRCHSSATALVQRDCLRSQWISQHLEVDF
jgi:hypothetical protein